MKCTILKRYLSAMLVMAASVSLLHADYHTDTTQSTNQTSKGNNQEAPDMADGLKAAGPKISGGADIFISADYLFWAADTPGIDNGSIFQTASTTKLHSVDSYQRLQDWSSGFKVGLGLNMSHDEWFTLLEYTWLRPHTNRDITATATQRILSNEGYNTWTQLGGRWKSDTHFDFNVIDWRIGRTAYTGRHLSLSTYTGLKGTWQELDTRETFENLNAFHPLTGPSHEHYNTKWGGVGILGGMDLVFYMTDNFYMEAKCALTGMWSTTRVDRNSYIEDTTTNTHTYTQNYSHKDYPINLVADLFLGLGYQVYFGHNDYGLSIAAGWETQVWVNWVNSTDLSLQGLDVKLRFDF